MVQLGLFHSIIYFCAIHPLFPRAFRYSPSIAPRSLSGKSVWKFPGLSHSERKALKMAIRSRLRTTPLHLVLVILVLLFLFAMNGASFSQERKTPQTAGVDNTKMGPYRALAQLAYAASQKGENTSAATLAKILERTWDKAEDYGGDTALSKTNHAAFEDADKAMDQFINLLLEHQTSAPDPAKLKTAYLNYLDKLKLAD
jgi:hypothetical protein